MSDRSPPPPKSSVPSHWCPSRALLSLGIPFHPQASHPPPPPGHSTSCCPLRVADGLAVQPTPPRMCCFTCSSVLERAYMALSFSFPSLAMPLLVCIICSPQSVWLPHPNTSLSLRSGLCIICSPQSVWLPHPNTFLSLRSGLCPPPPCLHAPPPPVVPSRPGPLPPSNTDGGALRVSQRRSLGSELTFRTT